MNSKLGQVMKMKQALEQLSRSETSVSSVGELVGVAFSAKSLRCGFFLAEDR